MSSVNGSLNVRCRNGERGIAMFLVLFALLLVSTLAVALSYSTNTESGINLNYRQEEMAYFASRAGVEELRDRIASASTVIGPITPPPDVPGSATGYVLYLINQGADPTTVQPWSAGTPYMDDELCHDGYTISSWPTSVPAPGVRCTDLPSGSGWYQTVSSNVQWNGTAAAVPYKWVRLAMKENGSVMYGDPAVGNAQNFYYVDSSKSATQPVCYDGTSERVPPAGTTSCAAWAPTVYANSVYSITSMAVSPTGARKVVQAEVGLVPSPPFPYGLLSLSTDCNSMVFTGNAQTDSYNSALGTYAATQNASGGDIGSFGNVNLGGNTNIQGIVGVTGTTYSTTVGNCNNGVKGNSGVTGNGSNWRDQGIQALPVGITPGLFPTPPPPNPTPPTTNVTYSKNTTLPPGTYGNINVTGGTLTLSPGVYNMNSLSASGQANITVKGVGQVVLNIRGAGGTAFSFAGQSITNGSNIPYDFLVNYAGTDPITLGGQNASYLMVNAPNAQVNVAGQGDTYGSIIANTINYSGNGNWHFDKNSALKPKSNQNYTMLSVREISY